ncbi:isochorismate synthase [Raineyella antarctica]|uniref:isochorismate synthase n=1 Tax=Raineyella antarctica TaxID=1577474 RepID=A0A1G6GFP1_9ACTN|nr:isochorismate synthase [Raineyella antarctica]SDB80719.1 isochorismate synthase [Raineyella antarctica]
MQPASLPTVPRLRSVTTMIDDPGPLRDLLPEAGACAWFHRDDGMIGLGEAARCEVTSLAEANAWWKAVATALDDGSAQDPLPSGVGSLAFGTFVFDDTNTTRTSVLVVPSIVVGSREGRHWMTRVGPADAPLPEPVLPVPTTTPQGPGAVSWSDGAMSGPDWEEVVAGAVERIAQGRLEKVVLARNVIATTQAPIDPRWLLGRLSPRYPRCWTFWVDDMVGATPEMLVRVDQGLVTSRVLAGTIWRGALGPKRRSPGETGGRGVEDTFSSTAIAEVLSQSEKNLGEHQLAVESVARALAPHSTSMNVPETPYVLELPNVMHLATDVNAVVRPGTTALALAAALHPSAAVCGTPTDVARATIAEIEGMDRGRYSGPVGWIDSHGNGEWAIGLRCGRLQPDGRSIEIFAGCGIVADSVPATELAESNAKLVPMRDALEG